MEISYSIALIPALIAMLIILKEFVKLPTRFKGPFSLPIIGHLHHLKQPIHESLAHLALRHGPVLLLRFGIRRIALISSLPAAIECFTTHDAIFADRPLLLFAKYFGNEHTSLFVTPYGEHWRHLRRLTTSLIFSTKQIDAFTTIRTNEIRSMLRQLFQEGSCGEFRRVEMKGRLYDLTYNVAMQMLAGKRYAGEAATSDLEGGRRLPRLLNEAFSLSGSSNVEDFLPVTRWLGMGLLRRRMVRVAREVDEACQEIIDEARRCGGEDENMGGKETVLSALLKLQQTQPEYYNGILIKGIIQAVIAGGTDTSSSTIEWAMSLLLNHPATMKKLQAEIDDKIGHLRFVAEDDLPNLSYLNNVIKETLRLFPPAPLLVPHQSTDDCSVLGVDIPRGTMLLVNAYAIQRDPEVWDEPEKFNPERFDDGPKIMLPFGLGRRRCPGEPMAIRVIGLALGALLQCFVWERIGDAPMDMTGGQGLTMPKLIPLECRYKLRTKTYYLHTEMITQTTLENID